MTTKGDRVLVWLTMFALVFGGLGATVSVFFSDVVMARRHPPPQAEPVKPSGTTSSTLEGTGIVVAVEAEKSRLVVDQQEIEGFMGPMVMGHFVTSGSLLDGLRPGEWIAEAQSRLGH